MIHELKAAAARMAHLTYEEAVVQFEREFMLVALENAKGNQCRMAATLGIHRNTVTRIFKRCGLDHGDLRDLKFKHAIARRKSLQAA